MLALPEELKRMTASISAAQRLGRRTGPPTQKSTAGGICIAFRGCPACQSCEQFRQFTDVWLRLQTWTVAAAWLNIKAA
jgi:hypothetical protein